MQLFCIPEFLKSCEMMWSQSVWSSTITAQAASRFLKEGGFVALPGAKPALEGTAGIVGRSISNKINVVRKG